MSRYDDRKAELDRLHRRARVARTPSLLARWALDWFRPPRPATPEPVPRVVPGQVAVTFGGHATALLRYAGVTLVFDPMLGRWVGGVHRAVEAGLTPADLAEVDVALISHAHADHLHLPTLELLPRTATVIVPPGAAALVSRLGFARVVELATGAGLTLEAAGIVAAPVRHGDDPLARSNAYVVTGDGPSVYLCGDSGYGPGFEEVGRFHAPDVALLPIAGYSPRSFRDRHMSPLDALYAFEDLRARLMIPIHHGAFALSYERLGEPLRWLTELVGERGLDAHVRILDPGESEVFTVPDPARDVVDPADVPERPPRPATGGAAGGGDDRPAGAVGAAAAVGTAGDPDDDRSYPIEIDVDDTRPGWAAAS